MLSPTHRYSICLEAAKKQLAYRMSYLLEVDGRFYSSMVKSIADNLYHAVSEKDLYFLSEEPGYDYGETDVDIESCQDGDYKLN